MASIVFALSNKIKFEKLSGQVLKNRTGTLRRSITPTVKEGGSSVTGEVATNIEYAGVHEFGYSGSQSVKAHLRTIKQAFGRPLKSPVTQNVSAHSRHVNFPERSFMRTALNEMEPQIRAQFESALSEVISRMRGAA
jgi:phage gpG-like protein